MADDASKDRGAARPPHATTGGGAKTVPAGEPPAAPAPPAPDDGGWYGWLVVLLSFTQHVVIIGLNYSNGVLFDALLVEFKASRGATSWVSSLNYAMLLGGGVFSGVLVDRLGQQRTIVVGGALVLGGYLLTSVADSIPLLMLSQCVHPS